MNFDITGGTNLMLLLIKIFFLVIDFMFVIFIAVVFRQFNSMNKIIDDLGDSPILKTSIISLLVISASLFLTALVIL